MAGDWLKMRHDLADDPAVIRLGSACGIDEDAVLGKLFRLWSWVDRHTVDGVADGVGMGWVDRLARCEGFGAALVRVGWLVESDGELRFPNFDRHCSDTAKQRALTKNRVERHRNAPSVTGALPEKRREEVPPPPREASPTFTAFRDRWNACGWLKPWNPTEPPEGWEGRVAVPGWLEDADQAIARLQACRYFTSPVTMHQFVGARFVLKCLGGQYDAPKTARGGAAPAEGKTPAAELAERWKQGVDRQAASVAEYVAARQRRGEG